MLALSVMAAVAGANAATYTEDTTLTDKIFTEGIMAINGATVTVTGDEIAGKWFKATNYSQDVGSKYSYEQSKLLLGNADTKKITINKTLAYVDGKYTIQPPKTPKSNRIIDIPQFLLDEIKDYMAKIYGMDPDDRLYSRSRVWLGEALTRVCKKINLRPIRVHDLRHSHASLLINLGANPLMIAERLGHDDVKMTMNTYSHLFQSHREEIIEKFEKIKF